MPEQPAEKVDLVSRSAWRIASLISVGVIIASVVACVAIAVSRSEGLSEVLVTVDDAKSEPRDAGIPFGNSPERLPDYSLTLRMKDGQSIDLGTKPNTSAVEGLRWSVAEPVSASQIATLRLTEEDALLSDVVAEVPLIMDDREAGPYRFDFVTVASFSVGLEAFFSTPIGKAIVAAFFLAVLAMLMPVINPL